LTSFVEFAGKKNVINSNYIEGACPEDGHPVCVCRRVCALCSGLSSPYRTLAVAVDAFETDAARAVGKTTAKKAALVDKEKKPRKPGSGRPKGSKDKKVTYPSKLLRSSFVHARPARLAPDVIDMQPRKPGSGRPKGSTTKNKAPKAAAEVRAQRRLQSARDTRKSPGDVVHACVYACDCYASVQDSPP